MPLSVQESLCLWTDDVYCSRSSPFSMDALLARRIIDGCQAPVERAVGRHVKLAPFEKGKANLSRTLLLPPSRHCAHFGSKASFLRRDLRTLNYSRSYRKRRKEGTKDGERKEKKVLRKGRTKEGRKGGTGQTAKLSIDQWKYSHSGDRQPRRERREGEEEGQAGTHCHVPLSSALLPSSAASSASKSRNLCEKARCRSSKSAASCKNGNLSSSFVRPSIFSPHYALLGPGSLAWLLVLQSVAGGAGLLVTNRFCLS